MHKPMLRQLRWGMLFALAPFLLVSASKFGEPPASDQGDYAHYLLHAKAIAEGRPYSDIGYIYTDLNLVGPANQPPGWPLVLAPFVAAFGVQSPVLNALMVVMVAAFALIAGHFVARKDEPVTGVLVAMFLPLAMGTYATSSVFSDPLFCVLTWITLSAADTEQPWTQQRAILIGVLVVAGISVRVAGIAILPALLAYLTIRHGRHNLRRSLPLVTILAVAAGLAILAGDHIPFLNRLHLGDQFSSGAIRGFVRMYRDAFLSQTLYPLPGDRLNDAYHLAIVPLVVIGAVRTFRKTKDSVLWYFGAFYFAMLFMAPVRDGRYLWPLTPVLVWWLVAGIKVVILGVLPAGAKWRAAVGQAVIVALLCAGASVNQAMQPRRQGLTDDPDTAEVFGLLRRLNDDSPVRAMFTNPRVLTLETGVPAMGLPFGTTDRVLREIRSKRLTHVILQTRDTARVSESAMLRLVRERGALFPEIFRNDTYTVREVAKERGTEAVPLAVGR